VSRGGKKKGERTLTQELASFLSKVLVPDLAERAKTREVHQALEKRYLHEKAAHRTSESLAEWVARTVEQVGAAWVLSCLFIRTLEDRELLGQRRLAGPGAKDSYGQFIELAPALTARDYLLLVLREVASLPAAEDVLGPRHNPAWRLSPSHEAARKLLEFFQDEDSAGTLKWTFPGTDTRFLGDLYQDLSEEVRKRYALLQTPHFVEKFILDLTLEPAIDEFGLEQVRLIDPTCGSGHFLLGAFERLVEKRRLKAPGLDIKVHAGAALAQVYGVDLNPYAVAIARFRLTLAYLEKAEIRKLAGGPRLPINLVVADSLLYGGRHQAKLSDLDEDRTRWGDELFDLEDPPEARRVFGQRYHAVVGNPPYITCKDAALRDAYRDRYASCYREYALAAPFTERFFELAVDSGFVGLINANSFMKREFGKRLIESVLPRYDLTRVVDTSGAYIPGHGTPTVVLFGRNQRPVSDSVPVVLGRRGEPATPSEPENGRVWSSIVSKYDQNGFEDEFVSISALARKVLSRHPWSLGGGGAAELKELLEGRAARSLGDMVSEIGFGAVTREDDAYLLGEGPLYRAGIPPEHMRPLVAGEAVRDWAISEPVMALWPYCPDSLGVAAGASAEAVERLLWTFRGILSGRVAYGKTQIERGLRWYEYSMFFAERFRTPFTIAFAFVATHNHFVLDRGGKVFNRTAPIIKLPEGATEEDHLALLGYLNSSTACFWMKQVMMNKGATSDRGVLQDDPERFRFEFDGTKLGLCPCPNGLGSFRGGLIVALARVLSDAAQQLGSRVFHESFASVEPEQLGTELDRIVRERARLRERMMRWQEELDWVVYEMLGLLPSGDPACSRLKVADVHSASGMSPDDRAYRGGSVDPERLEAIRKYSEIALIERPEYKRRWFRAAGKFDAENVSDEMLIAEAARGFLLGRIEELVRVEPVVVSVGYVCGRLGRDQRAVAVSGLLGNAGVVGFESLILNEVVREAVPFVSACRYTEEGLDKRIRWEAVWALQREEDAGASVEIPVPQKYGSDDFLNADFWRLRGKLDVPKERFISYPGIERDGEKDLLIGWAGWNHLQRAGALAALYQERKSNDGWEPERLTPLLAGLLELVPWLQQWHNEPDADFNGERLGDYYAQFVMEEARSLGLTLDDLRNWRPVKGSAKKRAPRKKKAPAAEDAS
jgi:hypothetical protein